MRLLLLAFVTVFLLHCTVAVPILGFSTSKKSKGRYVQLPESTTPESTTPITSKFATADLKSQVPDAPSIPPPIRGIPGRLQPYHVYEAPPQGLVPIYEKGDKTSINLKTDYVLYLEDDKSNKPKLVLVQLGTPDYNHIMMTVGSAPPGITGTGFVAYVGNLYNPNGSESWEPVEYIMLRLSGGASRAKIKTALDEKHFFPSSPSELQLYHIYMCPSEGVEANFGGRDFAIDKNKDFMMYMGQDSDNKPKLVLVHESISEEDHIQLTSNLLAYTGTSYRPRGPWHPREHQSTMQAGIKHGGQVMAALKESEENLRQRVS